MFVNSKGLGYYSRVGLYLSQYGIYGTATKESYNSSCNRSSFNNTRNYKDDSEFLDITIRGRGAGCTFAHSIFWL